MLFLCRCHCILLEGSLLVGYRLEDWLRTLEGHLLATCLWLCFLGPVRVLLASTLEASLSRDRLHHLLLDACDISISRNLLE